MVSVAEPGPPSSSRGGAQRGQALETNAASASSLFVPDSLGPILAFGRRQVKTGIMLGIVGTLALHGATAGRMLTALIDLSLFSSNVRSVVVERLHATYDVDLTPPPEVKPPPEPEPEPEPEPQPKVRAEAAAPPPTPAQAAKVLTTEADPQEGPVDLTAWGIVSGNADSFPGGASSNKGTSNKPVQGKPATTGVPNATGTAPVVAAPAAKDMSRPARPTQLEGWNCGFPAEADMEQINFAKVVLIVTVASDGRPKKADVLSDPGHGFGSLARQCALRRQYTPGLDRAGQAITTTTPPITVRFVR
jgi:periplasmic protein TonB